MAVCDSRRPAKRREKSRWPVCDSRRPARRKDRKGKEVDLSAYKGKVLVVNVASKCGLADSNYTQLTEVYNKYKEKR
ncbi:putative glutathione peroxidase 5 [Camellia lanceoleosa]|uniref:Glutathione peroxidase 5 n=1 Tax=Camellia lanceoleosa TaxID=1840588 RepID=A0ACC0GW88_9ERIC|nr:putative glutathione peroxidase 5 [Camellia lanceoleosa]